MKSLTWWNPVGRGKRLPGSAVDAWGLDWSCPEGSSSCPSPGPGEFGVVKGSPILGQGAPPLPDSDSGAEKLVVLRPSRGDY